MTFISSLSSAELQTSLNHLDYFYGKRGPQYLFFYGINALKTCQEMVFYRVSAVLRMAGGILMPIHHSVRAVMLARISSVRTSH